MKLRPQHRSPVMRAWGPGEEDVDLFAGGGGASEGKRRATGRSPHVAVNHWPTAIAVHRANHPDCEHYIEDVYKVKPIEATRGKRVRLLWASPTCFPSGTLVFTRSGLQPINTVAVGDEVLTHKSRWRKVTSTISKRSSTVIVRGQGHYGLETTPDHPFYSKRITKRWQKNKNGKRPEVRELVENPYWPTAETMEGKLWATPTRFADDAIPICSTAAFSDDFFYLVGRWLGDGFTSKGDVCICTGADDFKVMRGIFHDRPLLDGDGLVVAPRIQAIDTPAPKLVWGNASFARWLESNFGAGCEYKHLPSWALSMQESWRRALLTGYVDADGHVEGRLSSTSSVSKALSVGIRLLVASLGDAPCLYRVAGKPCQIDGRSFIGLDQFKVDWRSDNQKQTTFRDSHHLFSLVKEVSPTGRVETVYCLQVDEDESYVADGIVVHNCTHFSRAKGKRLAPATIKIRGLAWSIVPWIKQVRPEVIIIENVVEFETWGPICHQHNGGCTGEHDESGDSCAKNCPYGRPIKSRLGETFRAWEARIRSFGYSFEVKKIKAWEYGAPTTRERLYVVMRADGRPMQWPTPTHAQPHLAEQLGRAPWRTAADIIDWSIPCPSIFDRKKPHVPATRRRVARGMRKFVLEASKPFLMHVTHGDRHAPHSVDAPTPTVTGANRGEQAIVQPYIMSNNTNNVPKGMDHPVPTVTTGNRNFLVQPFTLPVKTWGGGGNEARGIDQPTRTITASKRGEYAIARPYLVQTAHGEVDRNGKKRGPGEHELEKPLGTVCASGTDFALAVPYMIHRSNGERPGQDPRTYDVRAPHPTVVAGGLKTAVVTAFVAKNFSDRRENEVQGIDVDRPITTVTGQDHHALVAASLVKYRGTSDAHPGTADIAEPAHTISAGGDRGGIHTALQAAFLARYNGERRDGEEPRGSIIDEPASTLDASNRLAVTAAFLTKFQQNSTGQDVREPQHTVMAGASRFGVVEAPLLDGAAEWSDDIARRAKRVYDFLVAEGIVGPWLDHDEQIVRLPGTDLVVYDIGMRMLVPRELFAAQGFGPEYIIELTVGPKGKPISKTEQVRLAGNSVCPDVAEALIRAALRDPATTRLDHEQLELELMAA